MYGKAGTGFALVKLWVSQGHLLMLLSFRVGHYKTLHTIFAAGAQSCHPLSPQKKEYSACRVGPNEAIKSSFYSNAFSHWDHTKGSSSYFSKFIRDELLLSYLF